MSKPTRSEDEIFADLSALCIKPGYAHAIAYFCFRDNMIIYAGEMKKADTRKMYSLPRLIGTEITTLIALMVKADIDWRMPLPDTMQEYIDATEQLLEELHHCMIAAFRQITSEKLVTQMSEQFNSGKAMREPIFYSGESAYSSQYYNLAARKYAADAPWLLAQRGFTIDEACAIMRAVERVHEKHFVEIQETLAKLHPDSWTMLPYFAFTVSEVATQAGVPHELAERILDTFTLPVADRNEGFSALQDFNKVSAMPILRMPGGQLLALQPFALVEALYEAPFYWMVRDGAYRSTLAKNRGDFTESFVAERLGLVFGRDRVFTNVEIRKSQTSTVGEIDVLVIWGDRAIIVQAKSKRLTLEARKGNDQCINDDFKQSVQEAYDQGVRCAQCLGDEHHVLTTTDGGKVTLPYDLHEIYLFCVVSDHYPALSFQSRVFLKTVDITRIQPPLVMDVFTLDAMTEMLQSPLQFLSYVNRRANYADRLIASQELTILGYHLEHNLWFDPNQLVLLADDFSAGLDIAMAVRRTGVTGAATPDGILTRIGATTLGRIVKEIETRSEPATISLGFLLLTLSEETIKEASRAIDKLAARARSDGKHHDLSLEFGSANAGLTVHFDDDPPAISGPRLLSNCALRQYSEKTDQWFGICMNPNGPTIRFGVSRCFPWVQNDTMDGLIRSMRASLPPNEVLASLFQGRRKKTGRNEQCPCGSGMKFKRCCLGK